MAKYSNQEIISQIQNGQQEILFYLTKGLFPFYRKWLRRKGLPDVETPALFTRVLVFVCREIRVNHMSVHVDFEAFLQGALLEELKKHKAAQTGSKVSVEDKMEESEHSAVGQCLNILDEQARQLLVARYYYRQNFEQIAAGFEFSNPVIAQFEITKAMNRLEGMVSYRLNTSN